MSDDQDVGELKAKLQSQAEEFQSYKQECKQIQQMLEEECQKKQTQIKQLKQEAIKKQKGQKVLKAQLSQFQSEINNLKKQLSQLPKDNPDTLNVKAELQKLLQQNASIKSLNQTLETKLNETTSKLNQTTSKVTSLQGQLHEASSKIDQLRKSLQSQQKTKLQSKTQSEHKGKPLPVAQPNSSPGKDSPKTQEQLKKLKQKYSLLQKDKSKTQKLLKQKQSQLDKLKHHYQQKIKKISSSKNQQQKTIQKQLSQPKQLKSEPKQPKQTIPLSQHKHQLSKLNQNIHHLQQKIQQLQTNDKQQKIKLTQIINQKTALLIKYKKISQDLQREKQIKQSYQNQSPLQKTPQIIIDDPTPSQLKDIPNVRMDTLLLTKKHYISPFIEIKDSKLIKLYKNTKNGFEKSLGATKHKFDSVTYDTEQLTQTASDLAKTTLEQGQSHTILVYGSRRTSKKQVFVSILEKMKDWLMEKIDEYQQSQEEDEGISVQVSYVKHSADAQVHQEKQTTSKEEIAELLEELTSSNGASSPKKGKKTQKPKVRYLLFSFGESLRFELITSSHLNPFIKQNETFVDYLNTVVFSKLPNILQSANHHYHIITLINPIVSEYEECKNTLSITMVPLTGNEPIDEPMVSTLVYSPSINREDLNDLTKKKLESFEKETEQASIRVRKVEEECIYFRNRFEELQVRLKNLINTHQQQNTYLKKSPVTLSYEKLLKFVNSVLARNISLPRHSISRNLGETTEEHYQNQVNMYIEEDAKSLDGY